MQTLVTYSFFTTTELYMIAYTLAFLLYACILIGAGLYGYYKTSASDDFGSGGRTVNYWITALSAHAADVSIWLFFGLPGAVYLQGLEECWTIVGLLGGMWFVWHFIAPRLRAASEKTNSTTLTHFLCTVAGDTQGYLTIVSSLLLAFFFLFYVAVGFSGAGTILEYSFGLPYWMGTIISALIVTAYISLGGHLTVALVDAFQAVFLLGMILMVPFITAWHIYHGTGFTALPALSTHFTFKSSLAAGIANAFAWGIGYIGMPHILTKFMSIDSVANVRKAQYVGLTFQVLAYGSSAAIGILAHWYFTTPPASSQALFLTMVTSQCAALLAGFILCAVLAAALSTLDAQLIVCASVIAKDVCKAKSPRAIRFWTRLSTIILASLGTWLALTNQHTLHETVRYAWQGLGSTFAPLVLMSLFAPKRLTTPSALFGILIGGLTAAFWPTWGPCLTYAPLLPGVLSGFTAMYFFPW